MADVIVIGGGAGGMMSAIYAAQMGASVTLLERNEKLGKKIYITGKGRCNVTNDCAQEEFLRQVPRNPRFLYSAMSHFSPQDMMALLESAGCPVVVQRGRRVFPATEKASDVTRALDRLLKQYGVRVKLNARVAEITAENGAVTGVRMADGGELAADAVILATGGKSYPMTGSTGDGYRMAAAHGHTIIPALPVLSAMETEEAWPKALQGLSLRNVTLTMRKGKKVVWQELGEMLFTHFGVSGPLVIEVSSHLPEEPAGTVLSLNLKPGLSMQQLDARLTREFTAQSRKQLRNVLPALLPGRMAEIFADICGIDGTKPCDQITRTERETLCARMQELPITISRARPLDEAIVTRGGVSVKEVTPATMESKLVSGLYFAGEVLDVDAHTGGYNLQIAWSTGALAGQSAAMR